MESTQFILENTRPSLDYPLMSAADRGGWESYYFNDPLAGKNVSYPKDQVKNRLSGGGHAGSGVGVKPSETGEPAKGQALFIV